jgi:hypothetical protein
MSLVAELLVGRTVDCGSCYLLSGLPVPKTTTESAVPRMRPDLFLPRTRLELAPESLLPRMKTASVVPKTRL